jgi:hypothetical protein
MGLWPERSSPSQFSTPGSCDYGNGHSELKDSFTNLATLKRSRRTSTVLSNAFLLLWNNTKVDCEMEFWTDRFTGITLTRLGPNNFSNPSTKQWDHLFTVRSSSYLSPRFTSGSKHFTCVCRLSNVCYTSHSSHQNMGEKNNTLRK